MLRCPALAAAVRKTAGTVARRTTHASLLASVTTPTALSASPWLSRRSNGALRSLRPLPGSDHRDATADRPLRTTRRTFLEGLFGAKQAKVKVDTVAFDKETTRYRGTVLGLPADDVMFFLKVAGGVITVVVVFYIFFKGYAVLTRFSMQTVARLGFFGGFLSCMILYTIAVQVVRRAQINANAVYNQSIALVMHSEKVQQFLGSHPRTGEFKTYSASGGFKLPLLRRIRSGTYELSDLLGLKPRRLQMLFVLKNPAANHEGIVACDVRRETTGFLSSTNVYRSLSITLVDKNSKKEPETVILIGKPEDVIYHTLLK